MSEHPVGPDVAAAIIGGCISAIEKQGLDVEIQILEFDEGASMFVIDPRQPWNVAEVTW